MILLPKIVTKDHTVDMNKYDYSQVEIFKGDLSAYGSNNFQAPKLTTVGGYLVASKSNNFQAPKLTTIEGGLSAVSTKNFQAPKLTKVKIIFPGSYRGTESLQEINEAPLAELPILLTKYKDNSFLVGRIKLRLQE